MDLGTVVFRHTFGASEMVTPCSSGDLLIPGETHYMEPQSEQSFSVRLHCSALLTSRDLPEDEIRGFGNPKRRLVAGPPRLKETVYVFLLRVHANSTGGQSRELCSDRVCVVRLASDYTAGDNAAADTTELLMTGSDVMTAKQFVFRYVDKSFKCFDETLAYERACLCGAVPNGFDPRHRFLRSATTAIPNHRSVQM